MRVLIGTTEISGIAADLCKSLRGVGLDVQLVLRNSHRFGYATEPQGWLILVWQRLYSATSLIFLNRVLARLWSFLVLGWAAWRFDTFIYLFGTGITGLVLELRLLRLLGKKVIVFYVGSDERPPFMDGTICLNEPIPTVRQLRNLTRAKKRRIVACEKHASICIGSPFSGQFHQRSFVKCFSLGIPRHFEVRPLESEVAEVRTKVRILHAPSQSAAKGSVAIETAIAELSEQGLPIEYIRLENASNERVLAEIRQCDFVVDQLYSDTPMSAFPTEAAYFGKPAVVGGYLAGQLERYFLDEDIPPTVYVQPVLLKSAIEKLVVDVEYRLELGRKAQHFVTTRWSSEEVGRRYAQLIQGKAPKEWWVDPRHIDYVHGYGLSSAKLGELVSELEQRYGRSSLCLSDKPLLEDQVINLARQARESS